MDKRILRILLVEDDEDDYVVTRDILAEIRGTRFELEWATNYAAAHFDPLTGLPSYQFL